MNLKSFYLSTLLFVSIFWINSCASRKLNSSTTSDVPQLKAQKFSKLDKLLKAQKKEAFDFDHLQSRLLVNYTANGKSLQPSITLRMQKDQNIWMSVKFMGLTVAKVLLTPNSVSFYEKIQKRAYEGNYDFIANFLGFDVDFYQIQNLLLGQMLSEVSKDDNALKNDTSYFEITCLPQQNKDICDDPEYHIYKTHLKTRNARIISKKRATEVLVNYPTYQYITDQFLPEKLEIEINSTDHTQDTINQKQIALTLKNTSIPSTQGYPFKIPEGYRLIEL